MSVLNIEAEKKTFVGYALMGLAVLFYLYSAFSRINQPISEDDLNWLVAAKSLALTGRPILFTSQGDIYLQSPHLYVYTIKLAFDLFGIHDWAARLPGIFSGLLALALVFWTVKSLKWGALMTLLYATTPALIQGSQILDNDNTFLVPAILFLVFSFMKYQEEGKLRWALATGLAVTLSLWVRITTPIMVTFLLWIYALAGKNPNRSKWLITISLAGGVLMFFLSWFTYCQLKDIPFLDLFNYTLYAFRYRTSQAGGLHSSQTFQNLAHLTLWVGPFTVLLFLVLAIRKGLDFLRHRQWDLESLVLVLSLAVLGGYSLVGGTPFGFPKYHSPGVALMFAFSGIALRESNPSGFFNVRLRNIGIVVAIAFLIQIFTVNDLLYTLRYQLREAAAFEAPAVYAALLRGVAFKVILYFSLFTILFVSCLKFSFVRNPLLVLALFALGSNGATVYLQNTGGYQTGYDYGVRGTREAAKFIKDHLSEKDSVVARSEILYYLNRLPSWYLMDHIWNDLPEFTKIISKPQTKAFSYSVATNPVAQIKRYSAYQPLQDLLRQNFDLHTIGSFKIWIRRK